MYTIYRTYRTMSKTGEETNMNYSKGFHEISVKMKQKENIISLNSTTPQHESVVFANGFGLCKATILHSWQVTQQEFPEVICNTSFVSLPQFLGYFNDPAINNNIVINGFIDH